MEERFFVSLIHCCFIAFGVIIGGAIIGSVGTFLAGGAPLSAIARIAQSLKIWAVVCAIGGTVDAIETFQKGLLAGSTMDLFKQFMLIISAMIGVRTALLFIGWIVNEDLS